MWVFANKSDGRVVYVSGVVVDPFGNLLPQPYAACLAAALATDAGLVAEDLAAWQVLDLAEAKRINQMSEAARLGILTDGQLTGIEPNPAYTPPDALPDPMEAIQANITRLEAAVARQEQAVAANLLASPHDRRWLTQKERAKLFGVGWIKANPACDQAGLEAALSADLAAAFPDQPLVVAAGVILSYAAEAHARGYIADPGFAALRDLIVASSESDLQTMLSVI